MQIIAVMNRASISLAGVVAVSLGNALAFYDFFVYSYFAIQIGHAFFPGTQASHGLLLSLASFGVGFITRPLGGVVIGRYGDRAGRKAAMLWSFVLMGVAVVGLALTPSFALIGWFAPALLLAVRLLQGFAVGGEVGPSTAFLLESAPRQRRGLYVSLQLATQYVAVIMAGGVGFILSRCLSADQLDAWGWRIALLLGGVLVPVGIYIRRRLPETLEAEGKGRVPTAPVRLPRRLLVRALMVLSGGTMCGYTISYMTTYAQDTLHLGANAAFGTPIAEGVAAICLAPLGGWLSDRLGRKPVALAGLGALLLLVVPCYYALVSWQSAWLVYGVTALLSGLMGIFYVPAFAGVVESLPQASRSGAVAILYAVAGAVFGGFTQFAVQWLLETTGSPVSPAWYMTAGLAMAAVGMIGLQESAPCKNTRHTD